MTAAGCAAVTPLDLLPRIAVCWYHLVPLCTSSPWTHSLPEKLPWFPAMSLFGHASLQQRSLTHTCSKQTLITSTPTTDPASLLRVITPPRRREAHVARNVAMTKEMLRQQHAFLMAYQADVAAGLREQGEHNSIQQQHQYRWRAEVYCLACMSAQRLQALVSP